MDELLMTPGPVSVSQVVQQACAIPPALHYGSDWVAEYNRVTGACQPVFGTDNEVYLLFGPGSAAIEMAFGSVLARGDWVVIPSNGPFGARLAEIATAVGLRVRRVDSSPLAPVPVEPVKAALRAVPARAIAAVHHETMLGIVNPIEQLGLLAHAHNQLMLVDAVSSFGGIDLQVDAWHVDICMGVGNKCVAGPVGIAPITASEKAWARTREVETPAAGWYLNLKTWRRYAQEWRDWHPQPTTMPAATLRGLGAALQQIQAQGLEAHRRKCLTAAMSIRTELEALGFRCLIVGPHASPVVSAVRVPEGIDVEHYMAWLLHHSGIRLAGVRGAHAQGAFRVAHMGLAAEPESVSRFLEGTKAYLACV